MSDVDLDLKSTPVVDSLIEEIGNLAVDIVHTKQRVTRALNAARKGRIRLSTVKIRKPLAPFEQGETLVAQVTLAAQQLIGAAKGIELGMKRPHP